MCLPTCQISFLWKYDWPNMAFKNWARIRAPSNKAVKEGLVLAYCLGDLLAAWGLQADTIFVSALDKGLMYSNGRDPRELPLVDERMQMLGVTESTQQLQLQFQLSAFWWGESAPWKQSVAPSCLCGKRSDNRLNWIGEPQQHQYGKKETPQWSKRQQKRKSRRFNQQTGWKLEKKAGYW